MKNILKYTILFGCLFLVIGWLSDGSDSISVIEKGINFEYNHQTDNLILHEPPPNTFYQEKEMYWTCWPDGNVKVLITYKASQILKSKMKQYSDEQYALGY